MLRIRAHYEELRAPAVDLAALLRARRDQIADEATLTAREREVLDLHLLGRTHEEIVLVIGSTATLAASLVVLPTLVRLAERRGRLPVVHEESAPAISMAS